MTRRLAALAVGIVILAGACSPSSPEPPVGSDGQTDPVLSIGREVYQSSCVQCHGGDGGGGRGPKLSDGVVVEAYPNIADEIAVVANGKGGMPAFSDKLTETQIEAVVRYTREVL